MDGIIFSERRRFAADHYHSLPGFCEPRHGHDWELEASVREGSENSLGPLLDAWAADMDGCLLNEKDILTGRNPTAEALTECLFRHLEASGLHPVSVRIREKRQYWAECRRDDARRGPLSIVKHDAPERPFFPVP